MFPGCFANGLPAREGAVLAATQRPLATSTFGDRSGVPAWKTIPSWDVIGTGDRIVTPAEQLFMARRAHARISEIDAPHLSMISDPGTIARVIIRAAQAVGRREVNTMTSSQVAAVSYTANRLTVEAGSTPAEFRSRYEAAVPPVPMDEVTALVQRQAPWQEMRDLIAARAPLGFKLDVDAVVGLAGDQASGVAYLMGNHILMERMFRHEPVVVLYAPLHTVIWGDPDGPAHFTFDKPSDQFASFGNPEITAVGAELDGKMTALLEHLGLQVPDALSS